MTDLLLDYDPNDTGEIPRLPGEIRIRIDTGEATQRIDPRLIKAPSFDAIPRKVYDLDDTVVYHRDAVVYHRPPTIEVVPDLLEGPQKPPPPLPKPKADLAETGVNIFGGLGTDLPEPDEDDDETVFRRGCNGGQPFPAPAPAPTGGRVLRLRAVKAAFRQGLWIGALAAVAVYSGLVLAALVVIR
jgi:hypothetical protein